MQQYGTSYGPGQGQTIKIIVIIVSLRSIEVGQVQIMVTMPSVVGEGTIRQTHHNYMEMEGI